LETPSYQEATMRQSDLLSRDTLTSGRPRYAPVEPSAVATSAALLLGSTLVATSGLLHLYLWADGYRNISTIGPLFLAQGIVGVVLAVALIGFPRAATATAGAVYLLATVAAFAISATRGLFGFMDGLDAPWATTSLIVESVGAALLIAGGTLSRADR